MSQPILQPIPPASPPLPLPSLAAAGTDAAVAGILRLGGPTLLQLGAAHRRRQQALALLLWRRLALLWRFVDPRAPARSWAVVNRQAVAALTAAQAEAARGAGDYVTAGLVAQGAVSDPVGVVPPGVFAGVAADGRDLAGLLSYPAFEAQAFVDQGMAPAQAAAIGGRHLQRIAITEVADAARVSTGVAQVADRTVAGYVRMLTPPSCARCVILAGRFYKVNAGFERHPQCDCVHIPAAENAPDAATDPRAYFDSLPEAEQDRAFTQAGAQAIRDGSDIGRVVNARRKGAVYVAGGRQFTREATTRRGTGRKVRLTPEQIYKEARGSRDEAIRLLKLHGYIR